MIEYCEVGNLRNIGKQVELAYFNIATKDYNSVERYMASLIFRFAMDCSCPILFIKLPKEGDEPITGIVFDRDFTMEEFEPIYADMIVLGSNNFGTTEIEYSLIGNIIMLAKIDFMNGDWKHYSRFLSGKNGIGIKFRAED